MGEWMKWMDGCSWLCWQVGVGKASRWDVDVWMGGEQVMD